MKYEIEKINKVVFLIKIGVQQNLGICKNSKLRKNVGVWVKKFKWGKILSEAKPLVSRASQRFERARITGPYILVYEIFKQ